MNKQITFIGAGNMAHSLIGGLIDNQYQANMITAIDPNQDMLTKLQQSFSVNTVDNVEHAAETLHQSDCIVLAVKPQVMQDVIQQYRSALSIDNTVFISIAAGISSASLEKWLTNKAAIVRCMPNTPALVQMGASVLYANANVSTEQKKLADSILAAVGSTSWAADEDILHAVTATSGSGPAYFFLLMEQMQAAAQDMGIDADQARALVTQTALGAATMAANSATQLSTLRENVTSKGGTTAAALDSFAKAKFNSSVKEALRAAEQRSREMATLFDQ